MPYEIQIKNTKLHGPGETWKTKSVIFDKNGIDEKINVAIIVNSLINKRRFHVR